MTDLLPLPQGFSAAGILCGIKADSEKLDLALYVSDRACAAAGVFTTNLVCGAPVKVSRERLPRATARAVVVNSGNSNAATGERGIADARTMTALVAQQIGAAPDDVLVCSTGVIGRFLPMEKFQTGIPAAAKQLAETPEAFHNAARAMMTTDTFPKQATATVVLSGKTIRISGVCKGAAMIAPNMATMLCVIMTDAALSLDAAATGIKHAVTDSFNCISVDGHESTSDSVILLANGAAGVGPTTDAERTEFQQALDEVAMKLATDIIRDAEGAHHFVQLNVTGCRNRDEAFRIAKVIADSPLVKTAICGADPNWGRIVSAAGYAGVPLQEVDMSLVVNGFLLYRDGAPVDFDAKQVSASLRDNRNVTIDLTLTHGTGAVRYWTADLTKEYVELNADYTT
ncbi:MAG: bifunctional glutamate N-acetyltransferase/amino-acid acetyltransferase ArgJ [Planctomycetes bacterium]|nr:bifunctional glutamate N-acetyltransferase/amino-acid acetyltransferase ArgJ [Planctomycetota bacterium]